MLKRIRGHGAIKNVRLIVYDFDGVMTDNKVIIREDGLESVVVNRSDGLAVGMIKDMGIPQVIISTEKNRVVETRARKLNIDVYYGIDDKAVLLKEYCGNNGIPLEEVVYLGNDINDEACMRIVGHPVCPSDASREIKEVAEIVLTAAGGCGVVRELLYYLDDTSNDKN
ncbi:MAG: HAD hydrolase family protein [Nitrospirae bacterium]|nr:HAD hydrolase family protein [Nitrospirota bacterium]